MSSNDGSAPTRGFAVRSHPLVTRIESGWVEASTSETIVGLTRARQSLLVGAAADGRGVRIRTQPGARLTLPLLVVLRDLAGEWAPESPATGDQVAAIHLTITVEHPDGDGGRIGATAEIASTMLSGGPPRSWGCAEPAVTPWSGPGLTAAAGEDCPADSRFVVAGHPHFPFAGLLRVSHQGGSLVEETRLLVPGVGADAAVAVLRAVAASQVTRDGVAFVTSCAADATIAPLTAAPVPVAALLGADVVVAADSSSRARGTIARAGGL